jgi:hypothetical protein
MGEGGGGVKAWSSINHSILSLYEYMGIYVVGLVDRPGKHGKICKAEGEGKNPRLEADIGI